jgi:hypothetical protein
MNNKAKIKIKIKIKKRTLSPSFHLHVGTFCIVLRHYACGYSAGKTFVSRIPMEYNNRFVVARVPHVIAIALWISGVAVAVVTTVLAPSDSVAKWQR